MADRYIETYVCGDVLVRVLLDSHVEIHLHLLGGREDEQRHYRKSHT